jgi:hypothetical protein
MFRPVNRAFIHMFCSANQPKIVSKEIFDRHAKTAEITHLIVGTAVKSTAVLLKSVSQDAEDGMLVRVKGNKASMTLQIATQIVKLSLRAFAANKAQLHQFARSTIDEYQKVQGSARSSNQRCSLLSIWISSP